MQTSDLTFVGAGAVLGAVIARLAGKRQLRVLSTRPLPPGVERIGWEQLGDTSGLLVCGLAVDEQLALQGQTERTALAEANLHILSRYWHLDGWRNRPVLVVTNPVEFICHRLWEETGNDRIYGFGIGSDRQRMAEILTALTGESRDPGEVTGFHAFAPFFQQPLPPGNLKGHRSNYSHTDCQETSLEAWTFTEFTNGRPPVRRACDNLQRILGTWPVAEVSGLTYSEGEPYFVGGRLSATGFTRPAWLEEHPEWPVASSFYRSRLR